MHDHGADSVVTCEKTFPSYLSKACTSDNHIPFLSQLIHPALRVTEDIFKIWGQTMLTITPSFCRFRSHSGQFRSNDTTDHITENYRLFYMYNTI